METWAMPTFLVIDPLEIHVVSVLSDSRINAMHLMPSVVWMDTISMVASFVLIMLAMNVQLNLVAAIVDAEGVEDATEDRDRVTEEDPDQDPATADDQVVGEDDVDLAAMIDPDRDQTEEAVTTNLDHDRNPDLARRADPDQHRDEISVISQPKGEYHVTFPFAIFL